MPGSKEVIQFFLKAEQSPTYQLLEEMALPAVMPLVINTKCGIGTHKKDCNSFNIKTIT